MPEDNIPHSLPETAPKVASASSLMEKRNRILTAWAQLAPQARFADMSHSQFDAATCPSVEVRNLLAQTRARISSLVSERMALEEELNTLLKRVASAVRCDPNHGGNSQLYRAMGFVPFNERKSPWPVRAARAAGEEVQARRQTFVSIRARYQLILAAWEQAGGVPLPRVTLEELRAAGIAFEQKRALIRQEFAGRASDVGLKKASDKNTASLIRKVAAGVISSNDHGIDSALYRAMGYIPGNERKRPGRRSSTPPGGASPGQPGELTLPG